ncbi:MAG: FAD-binding oxidoreductase [Nitrosarchaeum sp.]|nr:FAD-binding oxidoreductase [Nitrosarchaeum sp.]
MKAVLEGIMTPSYVSDEDVDLQAYGFDASGLRGVPKCVAWPGDAEQVRRTIVRASQSKISLVPRGFGTNLVGGTVAQNAVVLDLTRMGRILRLDRRNALVTVEAGCSLHKLQRFLGRQGMALPFETVHEHHTVGGLMGVNQCGFLSVAFGRFSELVHEYEFLDGTGKLHVTKDVGLLGGLEGCGGVVVQMTLKVHKPVRVLSMDVVVSRQLHEVVARVEELRKVPEVLRLEFLDSFSADILGLGEGYVVLVGYEDERGRIRDEGHIAKYWEDYQGLDGVLSRKGFVLREDGEFPLGRMYDAVAWCEERKIPVRGHVGLGVLLPMFGERSLQAEWYRFVRDCGGDVRGAYGIGLKKKPFVGREVKERLKDVKERFDYHNVFNPGKIMEYR